MVKQVVGVLPGAGVAVALGDAQADGGFDEVAAVELGVGLERVGGEQRCADAAGDWYHAGCVGGDVFDRGEAEVDGGGRSAGLVPLVGVNVGCGGRIRGRELADAGDAGLDGAA